MMYYWTILRVEFLLSFFFSYLRKSTYLILNNEILNQLLPFFTSFTISSSDERLDKPNGPTFLDFYKIHVRTLSHDCINNCPIR